MFKAYPFFIFLFRVQQEFHGCPVDLFEATSIKQVNDDGH